MPSGHAAASWALGKVLSSEFPDKLWLKFAAYGTAATISVSCVLARDHYPSDVLVGSTFGYLTGGYVVRHHSAAYGDDQFTFSTTPLFDRNSHTYAMSFNVTPQKDFDECTILNRKGLRSLRKFDPTCQ
jgi:hypothetical protein